MDRFKIQKYRQIDQKMDSLEADRQIDGQCGKKDGKIDSSAKRWTDRGILKDGQIYSLGTRYTYGQIDRQFRKI